MKKREQQPRWRPVKRDSPEHQMYAAQQRAEHRSFSANQHYEIESSGKIRDIVDHQIKTMETQIDEGNLVGEELTAINQRLDQALDAYDLYSRDHDKAQQTIIDNMFALHDHGGDKRAMLHKRINAVLAKGVEMNPPVKNAEEFLDRLQSHTFTTEHLLAFLEQDAKYFAEVTAEAREIAIPWVQEAYQRAISPEAQQYIHKAPEEIRERLQKMDLYFIDPLSNKQNAGHATGTGIALRYQDVLQRPEWARHVVMHEVVHHLSGLGFAVQQEREHFFQTQMPDHIEPATALKAGTNFASVEDEVKRSWLNEAWTELVGSFLADEQPQAYQVYIHEFWQMIDAGVPIEEIAAAMNEDMLTEPEHGTRIPAYDQLIRRIREVEGKGAMKRHIENIKEKQAELAKAESQDAYDAIIASLDTRRLAA